MKKHIGDKQFRTGQLRPLVKITPIAVACAYLAFPYSSHCIFQFGMIVLMTVGT